MTVHLLKMAVGVSDVDHLKRLQKGRRHEIGGRTVVYGYTRRKPRRAVEVCAGGSIYWIVKGFIQVRQRILDLVDEVDDEGRAFCRLHYDPLLMLTESRPHRPMQGWRYLARSDAPADLETTVEAGDGDRLPPEMLRELKMLGVI
ncbi:MAG: DUF1489 domain-containing protein [Pseudomonadota bacterium]